MNKVFSLLRIKYNFFFKLYIANNRERKKFPSHIPVSNAAHRQILLLRFRQIRT